MMHVYCMLKIEAKKSLVSPFLKGEDYCFLSLFFLFLSSFFTREFVRAISLRRLAVFPRNFKYRSVRVWVCFFFTFYPCHAYFRYFWVKKHRFFAQSLSALFLHNRLELSFQILNIGQWGCVVVPFSRFIHATHILGIFGWKKHRFLPQILSVLFLHNRLELSFQILNLGQWGCVVVPFSRFIYVAHILRIFGWKNIVFFVPNLVRAVSPQPLGVFISNCKHRSVGVCSCASFSRFIHVTHILGIFGWKNIVFCPKSCPRCFSITAWSFHFKF